MNGLTARQQKFVEEYLVDLNATQAALRAGFSASTARSYGVALLKNPNIREYVDQKIAERSERVGVISDRVVQELARIAFVNTGDVVDLESASVLVDAKRESLCAVASVKVKTMAGGVEREVKFIDKLRALELLGKHLGLFGEKGKGEGGVPVVIRDDVGVED